MEQRTEIRACPHCRTGNRVLLSKRALAKAYCGRCRQPLQLTYYEVLGVPRDADAAAIKRAYRALAAAWHPDRNASKHAAEVFSYLTEAYRILVHPERRQAYDTMLAQAAERSAGAPDASRAAAAAGGHNRAARAGDTAAGGAAARAQDAAPRAQPDGERWHAAGLDEGWVAELVAFLWMGLLSLAGVAFWALHHATSPGWAGVVLALSIVTGAYRALAVLYYVATGRRLSFFFSRSLHD